MQLCPICRGILRFCDKIRDSEKIKIRGIFKIDPIGMEHQRENRIDFQNQLFVNIKNAAPQIGHILNRKLIPKVKDVLYETAL